MQAETNTADLFDAAIIGAGGAGLSAALALSRQGLRVVCLDRRFGFAAAQTGDARTIALLQHSVTLLQNLGVWAKLEGHGAPLEIMRIVDDTGRFPTVPTSEFRAAELGDAPFGYNIRHDRLITALAAAADGDEKISLRQTEKVIFIENKGDLRLLRTKEGEEIRARLVIGADGPDSIARRAAGISAQRWRYDQTAIACWFSHSHPHESRSTEYHRPAGPMVTVPMQGDRSGLVWVEKPHEARRLLALPEAKFRRELEQAIHGDLGRVIEISQRGAFPLSGLSADKFGQVRTALVGHAAHVLPPIGAQGLNLGLRDAAMLADITGEARRRGEDIGGDRTMARYHKARLADVTSRTWAVDIMNRSLIFGDLPPLQAARSCGVRALNAIGPLRRFIMREGMGPQSNLPSLMRARVGN